VNLKRQTCAGFVTKLKIHTIDYQTRVDNG